MLLIPCNLRNLRIKIGNEMNYIELHARSAFSFLEGASVPEELIAAALKLEMPAMALLDRNGVYGSPRFHLAARKNGLKAHIGAEITVQCPTSNVQRPKMVQRPMSNVQRQKLKDKREADGTLTLDIDNNTPTSESKRFRFRSSFAIAPAIRIFAGSSPS